MAEKELSYVKMVVMAIFLSVFYVSTIFVSTIISYKSDILSFAYMVLIAVLYSFAFVSQSVKKALAKWAISIPFAYLVIQYFWSTNYSIRALNWVFPDYGKESAGGNFAGFVTLMLFIILCLVGIFVAMLVSHTFKNEETYRRFERYQLVISTISVIAIVVSVLLMERQFPSYQHILSMM
jgi:hypothetical protein